MGPLNAHTVEVDVLDDRFKGHLKPLQSLTAFASPQ